MTASSCSTYTPWYFFALPAQVLDGFDHASAYDTATSAAAADVLENLMVFSPVLGLLLGELLGCAGCCDAAGGALQSAFLSHTLFGAQG